MITCSKCKKSKSTDNFHIDKSKKSGHTAYCKGCSCQYSRNWQKKNVQKCRAKALKWQTSHKEKVAKWQRGWAKKNPQKVREKHWREYGIIKSDGTSFLYSDYLRLVKQQKNLCCICLKWDSKLVVDHDHKTGIVRGLLHQSCNHLLGFASDNIKILKSAIKYLKQN